jgi:hypothetical protein
VLLPLRCHRHAVRAPRFALPPPLLMLTLSRCRRAAANVALLRCRRCRATAKLPPKSRFCATAAAALLPPLCRRHAVRHRCAPPSNISYSTVAW